MIDYSTLYIVIYQAIISLKMGACWLANDVSEAAEYLNRSYQFEDNKAFHNNPSVYQIPG